jgi:hypothetical protein
MNGIAFHVEGIYEKGIPTPTAPQYSILPEVIPFPDLRFPHFFSSMWCIVNKGIRKNNILETRYA